jgi:hypothetical protein
MIFLTNFILMYEFFLAYLSVGDYNIIGVDWSQLARSPYYLSAATNTRDVGKATARLVDFLVGEGTPLSNIHMIGFSLGAHAAGWSGATITVGKLARITGIFTNLSYQMTTLSQLDLKLSRSFFSPILCHRP